MKLYSPKFVQMLKSHLDEMAYDLLSNKNQLTKTKSGYYWPTGYFDNEYYFDIKLASELIADNKDLDSKALRSILNFIRFTNDQELFDNTLQEFVNSLTSDLYYTNDTDWAQKILNNE